MSDSDHAVTDQEDIEWNGTNCRSYIWMTFREWLRFVAALATENSLDLDLVHEELALCGRPGFAANVTVSDDDEVDARLASLFQKWCYNGWK